MLSIDTIKSVEEFLHLIEEKNKTQASTLENKSIFHVDLSSQSSLLTSLRLVNVVFYACQFESLDVMETIIRNGGIIHAKFPDAIDGAIARPYQPFPTCLYSPEYLYEGFDPRNESVQWRDAIIFNYYQSTKKQAMEEHARSAHDGCILKHLRQITKGLKCVGIMGG